MQWSILPYYGIENIRITTFLFCYYYCYKLSKCWTKSMSQPHPHGHMAHEISGIFLEVVLCDVYF